MKWTAARLCRALEIHLWTFGEDGKVARFFHGQRPPRLRFMAYGL